MSRQRINLKFPALPARLAPQRRARGGWVCRLRDNGNTLLLEWAEYDAHAMRRGDIHHGTVQMLAQQLADLATPAPLHIAVPGRRVRMGQVALPDGPRRTRLKALPFAIEDTLATDLEQVHLAIAADEKGRDIAYAAIDAALMQAWHDALAALPQRVTCMAPEFAWLKPANGCQLRQLDTDEWIYFAPAQAGLWLQTSLIPTVLADAAKHEAPLCVEYLPGEWPNTLAESHRQQAKPIDEPLLDTLARGALKPYSTLNLLQGAFAQIGGVRHKRFKMPLLASAAMLILLSIPLGIDSWQMRRAATELTQAAESTYRSWFPSDRRIINIRTQVANHLNQPPDIAMEQSVLPLLAALNDAVVQANLSNAFPVTAVSFQSSKGELRAELILSGMAEMEALRQALASAGHEVRIEAADKNSTGQVQAVLRLTEGSRKNG